jgi:hypothetical protein
MIPAPRTQTRLLTSSREKLFSSTCTSAPTWQLVATFGADVQCVVGALQGSASVFEVYVERTERRYQQYSRPGSAWIAGPIIP